MKVLCKFVLDEFRQGGRGEVGGDALRGDFRRVFGRQMEQHLPQGGKHFPPRFRPGNVARDPNNLRLPEAPDDLLSLQTKRHGRGLFRPPSFEIFRLPFHDLTLSWLCWCLP